MTTEKKKRIKALLDKLSTPEEVEIRAFHLFSKSLNDSVAKLSSTDTEIVRYIDSIDKAVGKKYGEIENKLVKDISNTTFKFSEVEANLKNEISKVKEITTSLGAELKLSKKATNEILKKIQKDIEDLFWQRTLNGSNNVQAVLNIKSNGTIVGNNITGINFTNGTVVLNPDGTINYTGGGGGFTLLNTASTVDGSNQTFVFSTATGQPTLICIDGALTPAVDNKGATQWTWNNGTKTATLLNNAPTASVFAIQ